MIEQTYLRQGARLLVAVALILLGIGTLDGAAPEWPDRTVYAASAFLVAAVWIVSIVRLDRRWGELAEAGLLALALIRGAGYTLDMIRTGSLSYLAAIGGWAIMVAITARPLRRSRMV